MLFLLWLMSRLAREREANRRRLQIKKHPKEVKKKDNGYYHNPNWYYEDEPWGKEYEEEWI